MEGTFPNRSESVNSLLNPNLTCFANAGKYLRPASTCRVVGRPEPAGAISNGYQTIASPRCGALAMAVKFWTGFPNSYSGVCLLSAQPNSHLNSSVRASTE